LGEGEATIEDVIARGGAPVVGDRPDSSSSDVETGRELEPPEPPEPEPSEPLVALGPLVEHVGPWTKIPFFDYDGAHIGWLVHDSRGKKLDAHCLPHLGCKPKCHVHRVLNKDPIGYLAAWLIASRGIDGGSRDQHMLCRFDRTDTGPVSYEMRLIARDIARRQPLLAEFFVLEETYGTGEEPLVLS
jgi:hypothetical protein